MSTFAEALRSGRFVVTAELNPPKGVALERLFTTAERLQGLVDACNVTDSHSSRMAMAPVAAAHLLLERGLEPILQVTCRDRNRIALQADLLGAYALGVRNVLCMTGDPPGAGDHPEAKPVFDLDVIGLLNAVEALQAGRDLGDNALNGVPIFHAGAVVNPGATDLQREIQRMQDKIAAGARFFQTQAVYDLEQFALFMDQVRGFGVPVLAGAILLRSAPMARRLQATLPGISIPATLIHELEQAADPAQKGVEIAARFISNLRNICQGVHLMTIGQEHRIPQILSLAGLRPATPRQG